MYENIIFEIDGSIATLIINRPDKRNAVNNATVEEIDQVLAQVEKNLELRVLILTGAGEKAFVAGADIHELDKRDTLLGRSETRRRQEVYTRIEQLEIPSIAAINGWALGTGLELAMACTLRLASSKASLGQPEVKLGITPGAGGTQRLPRLIGIGRAMEMILTGDPVSAEQALAMGLVNKIVAPDRLLSEAKKLAETLASRPRLALQYAKEAVLRSSEGSLAEGLAHESYLHALSCGTQDKKEGVASFLQKRDPKFTGR
ncbi:MAG: enoyl-CoA hydratase/isomerase family protein [Desulfobacterales bacterium]|nr:MAG: enoyl-CoA hydratase/isomerase family protein [Desulfobacterales bacterium]